MSANNAVQAVTNIDFQTEVIESDQIVIVDFWAPWCGPCKMVEPVLDAIAAENDTIKIVKVNVDECQETANKFGVMSIPTILKFEDGVETGKVIGALPKRRLEKQLAIA